MKKYIITLGDPCGIGPEIIIKAFSKQISLAHDCIVFGNYDLLAYYSAVLNLHYPLRKMRNPADFVNSCINVYDPYPVEMEKIPQGKVSSVGGECAFRYVVSAIEYAKTGPISFITTAPLNKKALFEAGHFFDGHTEIFAHYTGGKNYAMLLWSQKLKCIHVSTHMSLLKACQTLNTDRIVEVIRLGRDAIKKIDELDPRIAVAGLNPHAGEDGLFGNEERGIISPAIEIARAEGINAMGPIAPDTVFYKALNGEYDLVVAMYHDQGHIPVKLLGFDKGVNITVGLDIIRTSVDHGTAFDIAGKFKASPDSLIEAILLGQRLAK
jgi:4-hydroxythreonine-4-phosphate dehydrogenase